MTIHEPIHAPAPQQTHPRDNDPSTSQCKTTGQPIHEPTHAIHEPDPFTLSPLSLWRGRAVGAGDNSDPAQATLDDQTYIRLVFHHAAQHFEELARQAQNDRASDRPDGLRLVTS